MTPQEAKTIFNFLLPQIEDEAKTTRRVLAAIPGDQGAFKPSEKSMSATDLAYHIAYVEAWFIDGVANGAFSAPDEATPAQMKTPSDVVAYYDSFMPSKLDALRNLSGESLAQPVKFYAWTMPAVAYLQFLIKHSVHHRGQLSTYLRPMGSKVPSIYGPSADESIEMSTQA